MDKPTKTRKELEAEKVNIIRHVDDRKRILHNRRRKSPICL